MTYEQTGFLSGWKKISQFLGRSVKTCQRWESKESLPVLRDPSGRPVALPEHLRVWLLNYNREYFTRLQGVTNALEVEQDLKQEQHEIEESRIRQQRQNRQQY